MFLARLREGFTTRIAHSGALGIVLVEVSRDETIARMATQPHFVGDISRGVLHTGVITALIDSCCGVAVSARIGRPQAIATLDLRVDYLRASSLGADLHCHAECHRLTTHVAFCRARVWQDDPEDPVAECLATFMRTPTRGLLEQK